MLSIADIENRMIDREFLRGFTNLYALWRGSKKDAYGMAILRESRIRVQ